MTRLFSSPLRAAAVLAGLLALAGHAAAGSILFIGNSFTYAQGSAVHFYRAGTVTDLNSQGIGGLPALFKSFTTEAGLDYDVYLETEPGVGLDWHLDHKSGVLGQRPWDSVVMHGYSTLDAQKPGDPAVLVDTVRRMSELLRAPQPGRRDPRDGDLAARRPDLRAARRLVRQAHRGDGPRRACRLRPGRRRHARPQAGVPVGDAWIRAMHAGVADAESVRRHRRRQGRPVDLRPLPREHLRLLPGGAGRVRQRHRTSIRVRSARTSARATSWACRAPQVAALEQVAFDQLAESGAVKPAPLKQLKPAEPVRCVAAR